MLTRVSKVRFYSLKATKPDDASGRWEKLQLQKTTTALWWIFCGCFKDVLLVKEEGRQRANVTAKMVIETNC